MSERRIVENDAVHLVLNTDGGHMEDIVFRSGGEEVRPMHTAPWVGGGDPPPADTPVVLRNLAGDFFCAPFCAPDVEPAPWHGWTSNATWHLDGVEAVEGGGETTRFRLERRVMAATVFKEITLRPGHPFVYQRHVFEGGEGAVPVAHHAMVRTDRPVTLSFSPKRFGFTPNAPVETDPALGQSALQYPQRFSDLRDLRLADGSAVDGTVHPVARGAEDLAILVDEPGEFAWSAALSAEAGFLFLGLKDPRHMPATMLWMSNAGRHYAPWSGRHRHCLGIEEICANAGEGHRSSIEANAMTAAGVPTAIPLDPNGRVEVRYAFGAIPVPRDWRRIRAVTPVVDGLDVADESGSRRTIGFVGP